MGDTNWLSRVSRQLSISSDRSISRPGSGVTQNVVGDQNARVTAPAIQGSRRVQVADAASLEPLPAQRAGRITITERPEIIFTNASQFPDKVKLRKMITIWPLRFKLRADYCRATRTFEYGCSCKDSILGGRLRLDVPRQAIEYTKLLPLGHAGIAMAAHCSYSGMIRGNSTLHPRFEFQYVFGGGAARWAGNQFDVRQKLRLTRNLALEACGNVQVPTPRAEYAMEETHNMVRMGEGAFHAHVAQLNLILEL